VRRPRCLSK
jgi:hypothetical protein